MKITAQYWGELEQQPVTLFTLENSQGMRLSVTNFGCIVTAIETVDRFDNSADLVLGYQSLEQYLAGHPFFGAVAGRYANRIANGRYQLDGVTFELETNELATKQHLHGGSKGFDKYVWGFTLEQQSEAIFIHFSRTSPAGESGYGGKLQVIHSIGLDELNQVHYNFKAVTDKPTVVNLVNHSYYNLAGHSSGSTDRHELTLFADFYTPVDENSIPTGEIRSVKNTALDFTVSKAIGSNKAKLKTEGFDHNFVLNQTKKVGQYHYAAKVHEPISGRTMTVLTTQPAVQFYNGFKLSNKHWLGKHGKDYQSCQGFCLETQHYPDSPNNPHFPSTRLDPNQVYEQKTIHRFGIE